MNMRYIAITILAIIYIIWGYRAITKYIKQIKKENNFSVFDLDFTDFLWFCITLSGIITYTFI